MACYLVTDSPENADLLERLLRQELTIGLSPFSSAEIRSSGAVRLMHSNTRSGAISLGRSILVSRAEPVALVIDSGTHIHKLAQELKATILDELRSASPGVPADVFPAEPELEECLFQDPQTVERLFNIEFSDPELELKIARSEPKHEVLRLLALIDSHRLLPALIDDHPDRDEIISRVRESPLIKSVRQFIVDQIAYETV